MQSKQRFFPANRRFILAIVAVWAGFVPLDTFAADRVEIADGRISFELPDGWAETDLNAGDVVAGYATQDNRSSAFFNEMDPSLGGSMTDLLDATVANFETRFEIEAVADPKTGQVSGPGDKKWPAVFTTIEAVVTKGSDQFEMRFYLLVFDTGDHLTFFQASTTKPIREARERQIYELIRSLVAKP